ncbi:hypothetical protein [Streptomyces sp. NPDC054757]
MISELLAAGAPLWLVYPLLLTTALLLLIRASAVAIAKVIEAMHPGASADAVRMQANRIQHRQWKAQRRDHNRRSRVARRAHVRSGIEAQFTRRHTVREDDSMVVLPRLVLPRGASMMISAREQPAG